MEILFYATISVLIVALLTLIYASIFKIRNKKVFSVLSTIVIIVCLAIVSFYIEPVVHNDLYRHFEVIDKYREFGFGYHTEYDSLIFVKLLFFFVSLLSTNHWLPVFAAIITYSIVFYIIYNVCKENNYDLKILGIGILVALGVCTYGNVVGRIRNALAFAILSLALYLDLIKGKNKLKILPLYIIPIFIHLSSLIIVGARVIFQIITNKKIYKYRYFCALWGLVVQLFAWLFLSNANRNNLLFGKIKDYVSYTRIDDIRLLIVFLLFIAFIYVVIVRIKKSGNKCKYENYINFLDLYLILMVGGLFISNILIRRTIIVLAFLISPLIPTIDENLSGKERKIIYLVLSVFILFFLAYSYVEIKGNVNWII